MSHTVDYIKFLTLKTIAYLIILTVTFSDQNEVSLILYLLRKVRIYVSTVKKLNISTKYTCANLHYQTIKIRICLVNKKKRLLQNCQSSKQKPCVQMFI